MALRFFVPTQAPDLSAYLYDTLEYLYNIRLVIVMSDLITVIKTGEEYIQSLRGRNLKIYLFGELVKEPVDHPMIRPSINAVAETYDLAVREESLASADSSITGLKVSRFLHIAESVQDLVLQNKMQRKLGQNTGTCFQRCVGMDALNALHSTTFDIDEKHGTHYHKRFLDFVRMVQEQNFVIGGAMTDPKGDRSKGPAEQDDPDLLQELSILTIKECMCPEQRRIKPDVLIHIG